MLCQGNLKILVLFSTASAIRDPTQILKTQKPPTLHLSFCFGVLLVFHSLTCSFCQQVIVELQIQMRIKNLYKTYANFILIIEKTIT